MAERITETLYDCGLCKKMQSSIYPKETQLSLEIKSVTYKSADGGEKDRQYVKQCKKRNGKRKNKENE